MQTDQGISQEREMAKKKYAFYQKSLERPPWIICIRKTRSDCQLRPEYLTVGEIRPHRKLIFGAWRQHEEMV